MYICVDEAMLASVAFSIDQEAKSRSDDAVSVRVKIEVKSDARYHLYRCRLIKKRVAGICIIVD